MVEAPSSPGHYPRPPIVSITLRRISGALDPRAIKVKLATVGFQKLTSIVNLLPSGSTYSMIYFLEVIFSIALKILLNKIGFHLPHENV
jgi:hypothetical protein